MRNVFAAVALFLLLSISSFAEPGHAGFPSVSTTAIGAVSGSSLNISATRVTGDGSGLTLTPNGGTTSRALSARTAERSSLLDFANVDSSGVSDSTSAIQTAYGLVKNLYVPSGTYIVSSTAITSMTSLRGDATMGYSTYQGQSPVLIPALGAGSIINLGSSRATRLEGVFLDGDNYTTADGIVGNNSSRALMRDVTILNTNRGIYGSGSYIHSLMADTVTLHGQSGTALGNLVDSFWVNGYIAGGLGNGISQLTGANDSIFAIGKIEFQNGHCYNGFESAHNILALQNIDRCGLAGVNLLSSASLVFGDSFMRRNGALSSTTLSTDAHISLGNYAGTVIGTIGTDYGDNDGGGGYKSPRYGAYINFSGGADNITFMNTDMRGTQGLEKIHTVGTGKDYIQFGNLGAAPEIRQDNHTSISMSRGIEGITSSTSGGISIFVTGHGLNVSNDVILSGISGTTEANGYWEISPTDINHFDLIGSTYSHAWAGGGSVTLAKQNFYLVNGKVSLDISKTSIASGVSMTIPLHLPRLQNFDAPQTYDIELRSRDVGTAGVHRTVVPLSVRRESGNASFSWGNQMGDEVWFSTSASKPGYSILATLGSSSPDGSVVDLIVFNGSANTQQVQIYVGAGNAAYYGSTVSTTNIYGSNVSGTVIYGSVVSGSVLASGVGSAASPAIQIGDNDSGWYRSFDNILNLSLGGTEKLRVSAARFSSAVPIYVGDASTIPLAGVHVGGPSASILVHGVSGTAPFACDSAHEGGMGWSLANHYGCVCDGTSWKQQANPSMACTY